MPSGCGASPWEFVKASVGVYVRASLRAHVYVCGVHEPCLCTSVCEGVSLRVLARASVHACPFARGCNTLSTHGQLCVSVCTSVCA